MKLLSRTITLILLAACAACGDQQPPNRSAGVYLLLDTSGTYSNELDKAKQIINYTLSRLDPGDSFAVARIDTGSFSEKDIIAKATFDDRPSVANSQKVQFQEAVGDFVASVNPAGYTDISGGLLQAIEYLAEKEPGRKTILIFSDMQEDLKKGYTRDFEIAFANVEVIALNVTKLRSDNIDPREYLDRLSNWQARVETNGGSWRVINDLDRLEALFAS